MRQLHDSFAICSLPLLGCGMLVDASVVLTAVVACSMPCQSPWGVESALCWRRCAGLISWLTLSHTAAVAAAASIAGVSITVHPEAASAAVRI